jgi:hypothetical protein
VRIDLNGGCGGLKLEKTVFSQSTEMSLSELLKRCSIENNCNQMKIHEKVLLEVMYKANYCLPCLYMDSAVRKVLPDYENRIEYRRVDIMTGKGKQRFLELSYELFGHAGVKKHARLAPVPSLFINGELTFDQIPPEFELVDAIEEALGNPPSSG